MYNIDDKIGRKPKIDEISTFSVTASGTAALVSCTIGYRNYIKVANNSAVDVVILSSVDTSVADGFTVKASGGLFEDFTGASIYIQSTAADTPVDIYERKSK